jgi:two-component system, response regulator YesN
MYRLLMVDDEVIILEWLFRLLSDRYEEKLDIRCASSSSGALQILEALPVDIALYDISMPHINGIQLAEMTRMKNPEVQIIFLTGHDDFDFARNAIKLGAVDYILKNEDDDALIAAVDKAIAQKDELYRISELEELATKISAGGKTELVTALEQNDLRKATAIVEGIFAGFKSYQPHQEQVEKALAICLEILTFANTIGLYADFLARADLLALLHSKTHNLVRIEEVIKKSLDLLSCLMSGSSITHAMSAVEKARQFVNQNLDKDLSLVSVADALYMNPSYLSYLYKEETGQNLSEYIREMRILSAARLLKNYDLQIQDVAQRVGYHNPAYFTRIFKQKTGYSPQEYREINRTE